MSVNESIAKSISTIIETSQVSGFSFEGTIPDPTQSSWGNNKSNDTLHLSNDKVETKTGPGSAPMSEVDWHFLKITKIKESLPKIMDLEGEKFRIIQEKKGGVMAKENPEKWRDYELDPEQEKLLMDQINPLLASYEKTDSYINSQSESVKGFIEKFDANEKIDKTDIQRAKSKLEGIGAWMENKKEENRSFRREVSEIFKNFFKANKPILVKKIEKKIETENKEETKQNTTAKMPSNHAPQVTPSTSDTSRGTDKEEKVEKKKSDLKPPNTTQSPLQTNQTSNTLHISNDKVKAKTDPGSAPMSNLDWHSIHIKAIKEILPKIMDLEGEKFRIIQEKKGGVMAKENPEKWKDYELDPEQEKLLMDQINPLLASYEKTDSYINSESESVKGFLEKFDANEKIDKKDIERAKSKLEDIGAWMDYKKEENRSFRSKVSDIFKDFFKANKPILVKKVEKKIETENKEETKQNITAKTPSTSDISRRTDEEEKVENKKPNSEQEWHTSQRISSKKTQIKKKDISKDKARMKNTFYGFESDGEDETEEEKVLEPEVQQIILEKNDEPKKAIDLDPEIQELLHNIRKKLKEHKLTVETVESGFRFQNLNGHGLEDEAALKLKNLSKSFPEEIFDKLTEINFLCDLSRGGFQNLCKSLPAYSSVSSISLEIRSSIYLDAKSVSELLGSWLKRCINLKQLSLAFKRWGEIHETSIEILGEGLTKIVNLEHLALDFSEFSYYQVLVIKKVYRCNNIGKAALGELFEHLNNVKSLQKLEVNFSGCKNIDKDGVAAIYDSYYDIQNLSQVEFNFNGCNNVTEEDKEILEKKLKAFSPHLNVLFK